VATSRCSYVTVQGPCIDRAGSVQGLTVRGVCIKCPLCRDRAGTVHGVFIVQGPCRDRAGTVHEVFFCCCMDRAEV